MSEFDIGYFKKRGKLKQKISRDLKTKFLAWKLGKDYYDGDRNNGYGGFKYDGRWLKILPKIIKKYNLKNNSKILDLGCKKGFIMKDLKILLPGSEVWGIEDHKYPIIKAEKEIQKKIIYSKYYEIPFDNKHFDLVIGFSSIYRYNFKDLVATLKEIKRVSRHSFCTFGSFSNEKEKKLFLEWSLLGTTILSKTDWVKLFKILNYKGDYYFTTAKSLNLY